MSTSSSGIIFGVFHHDSDAQKAIEALINAGFTRDQIGLVSTNGGGKVANYIQDLVRIGVPQARAEYYNSEFRAGHPVVSVNTAGREQEALALLQQYGAYDEQNQGAAQTADTTEVFDDDDVHRMKIREERLRVGKQAVQTGEASLHKEVVAEQQTIDVPVTHEEVFIERRPGSGQVSDRPIGQEETIQVPVRQEQVNVSKTTVETEEVAIGKQTVQEKQHISQTVRREEAHVDKEGNPIIHEVTVDPKNP